MSDAMRRSPWPGELIQPVTAIAGWLRTAAIIALTVWAAMAVRDAPHSSLSTAIAVLAVSTLWVQVRFPLVTLAGAFGGLALVGALGFQGPDDPFLFLLIWSTYGVGRHAAVRYQPWAAAAGLFFISINSLGHGAVLPADVVFPALFAMGPWLLGLTVQLALNREKRAERRTTDLLEHQAALLREAVESERIAIAREIHDVAAHTLTGVSLRAQLVRRQLEAHEAVAPEDVSLIEQSARQALNDLRRVVGLLRVPVGPAALNPHPGLDRLPSLIADCRASGQLVNLEVVGEPREVSDGLSLCGYRVVQEALANAIQHGREGAVSVLVTWHDHDLQLRIENPLADTGQTANQGHGLIGMRERIALFGGTFSAGPTRRGSWLVDAHLPLRNQGDAG